MSERERVINVGGPVKPRAIEDILVATPEACWRAWVAAIAADPQMDRRRTIEHIQAHVGQHMPNDDAPKERWEEWLAGTYNLLAILGVMVGSDPPYIVGADLLFRKWLKAPDDHTPPPERATRRERRERRPPPSRQYDDSGS